MAQALTTIIKVKDRDGRVLEEKEVATYAGVLAKAHDEGLSSIETRLLQVPAPDNDYVAIVEAKVTTSKGTFSGIGDANEGNVGRKIAPHIIRMAETRAKVRALRDAVNIGTVSMEELGNLQDEEVASAPAPAPAPAPEPRRRDNVRPLPVRPQPPQRNPPPNPEARQPVRREQTPPREPEARASARPVPMTENQRRLLYRMLAEQGFEGEAATDALLRAAEVSDLRQITKDDASALIDAWKREVANG